MMPTLYYCIGGRSFRALWAMAELGIECELRILPFPPRLTALEFLDQNPLGTIPLLVNGDTRMRESAMIGHYLAVRAGSDLAVAPAESDHGRYLDALAYGETTLTWPTGVGFLYSIFLPEGDPLPRVIGDMRARLQIAFADVDRLLGTREWIAADRFTMADISISYALHLASRYADLFGELPANLARYLDRLTARPGYRDAVAREQAG